MTDNDNTPEEGDKSDKPPDEPELRYRHKIFLDVLNNEARFDIGHFSFDELKEYSLKRFIEFLKSNNVTELAWIHFVEDYYKEVEEKFSSLHRAPRFVERVKELDVAYNNPADIPLYDVIYKTRIHGKNDKEDGDDEES